MVRIDGGGGEGSRKGVGAVMNGSARRIFGLRRRKALAARAQRAPRRAAAGPAGTGSAARLRSAGALAVALTIWQAATDPRPLAAQRTGGAPGAYPGITLTNIQTPLPAAPTPAELAGGTSPYKGSVPAGEATGEMLQLSLAD